MRTLLRLFVPAVVLAGLVSFGVYQAADKPKFDIETIMEKAHGQDQTKVDGLLKKVLEDKANKDEKQMLLDLYKDLALNKPPKGDPKSWKEKTDALVTAAQAVVADAKDSKDKMKMAANCEACHKAHQP
jgi:hypothetical protein